MEHGSKEYKFPQIEEIEPAEIMTPEESYEGTRSVFFFSYTHKIETKYTRDREKAHLPRFKFYRPQTQAIFEEGPSQSLQHLVKAGLTSVQVNEASTSAICRQVDYLDPVEVRIQGEILPPSGQYSYRIGLYRYDEKLFEEEKHTFISCEFLSNYLSAEDSLSKSLRQAPHPFELRLKNGVLYFQDNLGKGILSPLSDVPCLFWTRDHAHSLEVEMSCLFQEITHHHRRSNLESRAKVMVALLNRLLPLQKTYSQLERVSDSSLILTHIDINYIRRLLVELASLYNHILKPLFGEDASNTPSQDKEISFFVNVVRMFFLNIVGIVDNKKLVGQSLLNVLSKYSEASFVIEILPKVISFLFSQKKAVQEVRNSFKSNQKKVSEFYDNFSIEGHKFQAKGMVWRYSTRFLRLLKDHVLLHMIAKAHGSFQLTLLGEKRTSFKEPCFKVIDYYDYSLHVCEGGTVLYYKQQEPQVTPYSSGFLISSRDCYYDFNRKLLYLFIDLRTSKEYRTKVLFFYDLSVLDNHSELQQIDSRVKTIDMIQFSLKESSITILGKEHSRPDSKYLFLIYSTTDIHKTELVRKIKFSDICNSIFQEMDPQAFKAIRKESIDLRLILEEMPSPMKKMMKTPIKSVKLTRGDTKVFNSRNATKEVTAQYENKVALRTKFRMLPKDCVMVQILKSEAERMGVWQNVFLLDLYSGTVTVKRSFLHSQTHFLDLTQESQNTSMFESQGFEGIILFSRTMAFHLVIANKEKPVFTSVISWRKSRIYLSPLFKYPNSVLTRSDEDVHSSILGGMWTKRDLLVFATVYRKEDLPEDKDSLPLPSTKTMVSYRLAKLII